MHEVSEEIGAHISDALDTRHSLETHIISDGPVPAEGMCLGCVVRYLFVQVSGDELYDAVEKQEERNLQKTRTASEQEALCRPVRSCD